MDNIKDVVRRLKDRSSMTAAELQVVVPRNMIASPRPSKNEVKMWKNISIDQCRAGSLVSSRNSGALIYFPNQGTFQLLDRDLSNPKRKSLRGEIGLLAPNEGRNLS